MEFDCIVVGAGHAGIEAALASARMGKSTLLTTINLDSIGFLPCNPSIGGTAKGHLVFEIDALGGAMGVIADRATIQRQMLNSSKGPAVHSLRAQVDKNLYHEVAKQTIEEQPNLKISQAEVAEILTDGARVTGVKTSMGTEIRAKTVILCTGVYLNSRIIIGEFTQDSGPNGFLNAKKLSDSLRKLGFNILRFKTGTPMRIDKNTISLAQFEEHLGEEYTPNFSMRTKRTPKNTRSCFLGHTNKTTHEIIRQNLHLSPLYQGIIKGIGPRYCPSIEDKVVRFADKERHQLFLEPEGLKTKELYIQGISTSLPFEVQQNIVHSIKGMENAWIMRPAYAIEYDCIDSTQLKLSLESKLIAGLFCAGQINGTSGYEEAAAQGLLAGINSSLYIDGKDPFTVKRGEGYIGVLVDDLVTKGTNEPYRMMTSRAEHRLSLRQDNADLRLTERGFALGLVSKKQFTQFKKKEKQLEEGIKILNTVLPPSVKLQKLLEKNGEKPLKSGILLKSLLKRPNIDIFKVNSCLNLFEDFTPTILTQLNTLAKYEGYIAIQQEQMLRSAENEGIKIPAELDYLSMHGLRIEARQKLSKFRPETVGQASRISGVSPADITVLILYIKKSKN